MSTTNETIRDLKGNIIGTIAIINGERVWIDNHGNVIGKVICPK